MLIINHRFGYTYPTVTKFDDNNNMEPIWGLGNRRYRYVTGLDKPNYPVPARIYHFDGDIVEPPNSVLSNGDISSIWWQVGSPNVMRFESEY